MTEYSQLSLRRTPLVPALSVRLREVSVLEVSVKRESTVKLVCHPIASSRFLLSTTEGSNQVTEGVITTRSNRMKFRLK